MFEAVPVDLPVYKIKGKYYFRDTRLQEYRNICNPNLRIPFDEVHEGDLETPTREDSEKVYHDLLKKAAGVCDRNPCNLKVKGKRRELNK